MIILYCERRANRGCICLLDYWARDPHRWPAFRGSNSVRMTISSHVSCCLWHLFENKVRPNTALDPPQANLLLRVHTPPAGTAATSTTHLTYVGPLTSVVRDQGEDSYPPIFNTRIWAHKLSCVSHAAQTEHTLVHTRANQTVHEVCPLCCTICTALPLVFSSSLKFSSEWFPRDSCLCMGEKKHQSLKFEQNRVSVLIASQRFIGWHYVGLSAFYLLQY